MRKYFLVYSLLLISYSIVMLVYIIAGSHGLFISSIKEAIQVLGLVFTFLITSFFDFIIEKRGGKA
jgi:cbb3-type cytochrome oxidase subunit 1